MPACADFYIDDEYTSVVGNKASGIVGFAGYINELYETQEGKLLGYKVRETFEKCTKLESLNLTNKVKSIDYEAFNGCSSLTQVGNLSGVTSITESTYNDGGIFYGCSNLKVDMDLSSLETISSSAGHFSRNDHYYFGKDSGIKSIKLGSITTIPMFFFAEMPNLEKIEGASSVKCVYLRAFYNCPKLKSIDFSNELEQIGYYSVISGSVSEDTLNNTVDAGYGYVFSRCSSLESVGDVGNVSYVFRDDFYECQKLESLNFTNKLRMIGAYAFYNCYALESVGDLSNVTNVYAYAFFECQKLVSVNLTDKIDIIQEDTFYDCSLLTAVGDLSNVTKIYGATFSKCKSLESVNLTSKVTLMGNSSSDYISNTNMRTNGSYNSVFYNCESLTSVGDLSGLDRIGCGNFYNCKKLEEVGDISSVRLFASYAFYNCESLTLDEPFDLSVVGNLGDYSFYNCKELPLRGFSLTVTTIPTYCFYNCDHLEIDQTAWISASITKINTYAYAECDSLTLEYLPQNMSNVYEGAFYNCPKVVIRVLPNSNSGLTAKNCYNVPYIVKNVKGSTSGEVLEVFETSQRWNTKPSNEELRSKFGRNYENMVLSSQTINTATITSGAGYATPTYAIAYNIYSDVTATSSELTALTVNYNGEPVLVGQDYSLDDLYVIATYKKTYESYETTSTKVLDQTDFTVDSTTVTALGENTFTLSVNGETLTQTFKVIGYNNITYLCPCV